MDLNMDLRIIQLVQLFQAENCAVLKPFNNIYTRAINIRKHAITTMLNMNN